MIRRFVALFAALPVLLPGIAAARPLTVDDVLALERLDRATLSPDGALVAAVVLRGAGAGEVYGRAAYEVDPSRGDVLVIDRATGRQRQLTRGADRAAGAWCATWSPDGQRLAMLSTRPEGREPRGGDNVRLYVWDRGRDRLRRLGDWAVLTQTRYGSGLHRLDMAGPGAAAPDPCLPDEENPPFVWLDARRLLVAALPAGQVAGLLDDSARPGREAARDAKTLRAGGPAAVSVVGSGAERTGPDGSDQAILAIVDTVTGERRDIATIPAYPFNGSLGVRVSADGRRAAVLATVATIPPRAGVPFPRNDGEWLVEKRLGLVDLAPAGPLRWLDLPAAARWPVALTDWSGTAPRFTARARAQDNSAADFAIDPASGAITAAPKPAASPTPPPPSPSGLPDGATLVASDARGLIWRQTTSAGTVLGAGPPGGPATELLRLNRFLAAVDPGEVRRFSYPGPDGQPLLAAVLLPPGYAPGQRLPVITWVYGGASLPGFADYHLAPDMPGIYNLRLYAAHGYAVLLPSIPLKHDGSQVHLDALAPLVAPAVRQLAAMGIADPDRVGVFGQSYGGFTALGLAATSHLFRAVVAVAPLSDFAAYYGGFDPTSRGWPGIEHEKSANPPIAELGALGLVRPLYADPGAYHRGSPLDAVARVEAPVLLIHGEADIRGAPYQSEAFFIGLWRQGKTARLLRYWGEDHALARSPATVRSVTGEILRWFDTYLAPVPPNG